MSVIFLLISAMCFGSMALILHKPTRLFQFPYFMSLSFTAWILPQLYGLVLHDSYPEEMVEDVALMSLLCLSGCFWGYWLSTRRSKVWRTSRFEVDPARLAAAALVLTIIGIVANILILSVPEAEREGAWTGTLTKYAFFSKLALVGYTIGVYCYLRWRNRLALMATLMAAAFPLYAVIFYGRREPAAHIFFVTLFAIYLVRGIHPPRWMVAMGLAVALLLIPNIGEYRSKVLLSKMSPWEAIRSFEIRDLWAQRLEGRSGSEVTNAMHIIAATKEGGSYQWGKGYWNQLVHAYIPRQYLGEDFKYGLMLDGADVQQDFDNEVWESFGYRRSFGSTMTGVGDSYRQFGLAGCLVFFFLGVLFRHLEWGAIRHARPEAGLFFMVLSISAMKAVTHQTLNVPSESLYYLVFVGGALILSRKSGVRRHQLLTERTRDLVVEKRSKAARSGGATGSAKGWARGVGDLSAPWLPEGGRMREESGRE